MTDTRVERKLAAILAADVAGYSQLMGKDEIGTRVHFNGHLNELINPSIAKSRGRLVKTTGDGILVEFASVVDAVQCAVEIQQGVTERNENIPHDQRIEFRIGINLGDVIVEGDDIHGDGVNVAARLEGLAEPGEICISRAARDQIRDKLGYGLEDMGEVRVKNISRPVRAFRVLKDGATVNRHFDFRLKKQGRWLAASLLVAAIVGVGFWWWQPWSKWVQPARPDRIAFPLPDKPSIAILPFTNLSGDPKQDYFAEGFTEDLITNIAQSKELFVIARNSSFTYKGRSVKIRQVAEELGVRYVLEGSIRRIGEEIRITAQLIDATNGAHVWAKQYDNPIAKLFDVQDELSRVIAASLLVNIGKSDLAKASQKRPNDHSAYDYMLQAREKNNVSGKEALLEARSLAELAIAIDPNYAAAYVELGRTYNRAYINRWEGPEALEQAYDVARKAVELDPLSSAAHELLGRIFLRRRQHSVAIAAIERAITLDPNRSDNYASLADVLTFANRAEEATKLMYKSMRLNPFYPPRYNMYLGRAYYFAKQFDKAAAELENCAARAPKRRSCFMYLIPAYAELGELTDAKRSTEKLLNLAPKFAITTSVEKHLPFVPTAMQFYLKGLRKAGVPE